MDIQKYIKPGKDAVIEIEQVEYLLDDQAIASIEQGHKEIVLTQLFDHQPYTFNIEVVLKAIERGAVDYLDKSI